MVIRVIVCTPYQILLRKMGKARRIKEETIILLTFGSNTGYAVAQLVEALCYKPESRGFVSQWSH
jgi:hypothetical protein